MEKSLSKKWLSARKAFLRNYGTRASLPRIRSTARAKQRQLAEPEVEIADTDDGEWLENFEELDS